PIAGLGGRVGLKGTDGMAEKAIALGARALAPQKAARALAGFKENRWGKNRPVKARQGKEGVQILTPPGSMGETIAREAGFFSRVVDLPLAKKTSGADTIAAAKKIQALGADLLLFVGGDGTARDICSALGESLPVIGVPAGVKIHSPVFATTPETAGWLAQLFLGKKKCRTCEQEVLDIDEDAYRKGRVSTRLYGYLQVPDEGGMQNRKAGTPLSQRASQNLISLAMIDAMEADVFYLVGPGSTMGPVLSNLNLDHSLLGVDVVQNRQLVKKDATEKQILEIIKDRPFKILITPIGGQGYLFGRGNHQFSPKIIQGAGKKNIGVGATLEKIGSLRGEPFLVDTGDKKTDRMLAGYIRVVTGYRQEMIYPIV
ncbi:MAG: ATP-NAD kinase family protein, partial [Desulfobacteraceae bacterium]|nr:ATP-NAD kinase family protein [Desulfobacteraceae bacterium]